MKRNIALFGSLFIIIMFLSGPAMAQTWHYAVTVEHSTNCTNPTNALGAPDYRYATIGINGPPAALGAILLNLSYTHEMGAGQNFTVFASSAVYEEYDCYVSEIPAYEGLRFVGVGDDTTDCIFTTPSTPPLALYLYVYIVGTSGIIAFNDQIYGPEIDAVGWYG